jgi:hypothetical protein
MRTGNEKCPSPPTFAAPTPLAKVSKRKQKLFLREVLTMHRQYLNHFFLSEKTATARHPDTHAQTALHGTNAPAHPVSHGGPRLSRDGVPVPVPKIVPSHDRGVR